MEDDIISLPIASEAARPVHTLKVGKGDGVAIRGFLLLVVAEEQVS